MPPLVIPPLIKVALGAAGAVAVAHWLVREARRVGAELERIRVRAAEPFRRELLPTLRRDPATGEWRVSNQ
jgi:hypothetical protein